MTAPDMPTPSSSAPSSSSSSNGVRPDVSGPEVPDAAHDDLIAASVRSGLLSMRVLLPAPPTQVWQQLTRPDLLGAWSPVLPDRVLDSVGPARGAAVGPDGELDLTVLEVFEGFRLVHRWGAEELIWQLAPSGEATQLQLVQRLADPDAHAAAAAGWHGHLRALEAVLRGSVPEHGGDAANETALAERYAAAITVNNADN